MALISRILVIALVSGQVVYSWLVKSSLTRLSRCMVLRQHIGAISNEWDLKRYPEDFIVIEDGCLCKPEDVEERTNDEAAAAAVKRETMNDVEEVNFRELLSKKQMDILDSISDGEEGIDSTVIEITPSLSKVHRTLFHQQFVRNEYPRLDSKTETGGSSESTRILIYKRGARSIEADQNGGGRDNETRDKAGEIRRKKGKRKAVVQRWDSSKPDYLHFTLYKNLMTTDEALDLLAKKTGCLPTRFAVSGSKDRFAITAQRVSAWRVERSKLDDYGKDTQRRRDESLSVQVDVRDVVVGSGPLSLGALRGNTFSLRLRPKINPDRDISEKEAVDQLSSALRSLEGHEGEGLTTEVPFVNFFGPQRFGSPVPVNVAVGRAVLQEDYRKAVLLLLLCPGSAVELEMAATESGGFLTELEGWLSPPEHESLVPFLQGQWRDHAKRMSLKLASYMETGGPVRSVEGVRGRIEFLSAFLGAADLPEVGRLETAKAFPFAQKKLLDNLLEQMQLLSKKGKGRGRGDKDGEEDDGGELVAAMDGGSTNTKVRVSVADLLKLDFKKAFSQALGRNLRLLFVNAYQSHLFNLRAQETAGRAREGPSSGGLLLASARACEGDLVLVDSSGSPLTAWDVSERNISMIGNAVPPLEDAHSRGGKKPRQAYYHTTTAADERDGVYGLESVIAVLPGYATAKSSWIEKHLSQDGCGGLLKGGHSDGMYRLPGAYRHVISQARNFRASAGALNFPEQVGEGGGGETPRQSYSDTVEAMYNDGRLGGVVRGLRRSMERRACDEGEKGVAGVSRDEAAVELLFSLCASSYATSFVASLLA